MPLTWATPNTHRQPEIRVAYSFADDSSAAKVPSPGKNPAANQLSKPKVRGRGLGFGGAMQPGDDNAGSAAAADVSAPGQGDQGNVFLRSSQALTAAMQGAGRVTAMLAGETCWPVYFAWMSHLNEWKSGLQRK